MVGRAKEILAGLETGDLSANLKDNSDPSESLTEIQSRVPLEKDPTDQVDSVGLRKKKPLKSDSTQLELF